MYIDRVPNRNSPPAILLRESWREGGRIRKRTLTNLSHWPEEKIQALQLVLKDVKIMPQDALSIERSLPHGHVEAVLGTMRKIGLDSLVASKPCRERDLVLAMIAQRLIHPCSKLATTRLWHSSTLAQELGVEDADEDELYEALDWLGERQRRIERKLARRHLQENGLTLYDVSSSSYEGHTCPLARYGYNRDGKKGLPVVVYGVITNGIGCPVAVDVYPGNTGDPSTVPDQVEKLRGNFGLERVLLVGDRGMLTATQISHLREYPQLGWISSLRAGDIRKLVDAGNIQRSLFDAHNLAEITSPDFPGERLIVCFNPLLADERKRKREELLRVTEKDLDKIVREVSRRTRTPMGKDEIGLKVGKVIGHYKMQKHFQLTIEHNLFRWERNGDSIAREEALDGIYVVRTSEPKERLSAEDAVRSYKSLSHVERVFRTLKGLNLRVRPIFHRVPDRVRAHIFLCLLAYYVEWHMRQALAPLLFDDEELPHARQTRDPVAPAAPSSKAKRKKTTHQTSEGFPVHSFQTLFVELGTRCRNYCRMQVPSERSKSKPTSFTFTRLTDPTPLQLRVFQLLDLMPVRGN